MSNLPRGFYTLAILLLYSILFLSLLEQIRDPSQPKPMSHLLSAIYILSTSLIANILDAIATLLKAILADEQSAITGLQIWLTGTVAEQQKFISRVLYSRTLEILTLEILWLVVMFYVNFIVISVIVIVIAVASLAVCEGYYYGINWLLRDDEDVNATTTPPGSPLRH